MPRAMGMGTIEQQNAHESLRRIRKESVLQMMKEIASKQVKNSAEKLLRAMDINPEKPKAKPRPRPAPAWMRYSRPATAGELAKQDFRAFVFIGQPGRVKKGQIRELYAQQSERVKVLAAANGGKDVFGMQPKSLYPIS